MTAAVRRIAIIISALCLLPGCADKTDLLSCSICGKTGLEVDQISHEHGVGVCAQQARCRNKGHYVLSGEDAGEHDQCGICQGWLCSGIHGEGRCQAPATPEPTPIPTPRPTLEPTPTPEPTTKPTPTPVQASTPEPEDTPEADSTPLPEPTAEPTRDPDPAASPVPGTSPEPDGQTSSSADGDWTLEDFFVTMEDGSVHGLSRPEKRRITCTGETYATVTALPRSPSATVTGDVGRVNLQPGENRFQVTVTAKSGYYEVFNFVIINE